jgi:origin recognition complex subunit 5
VLRTSFVPHVHFPNYNKSDFVKILSKTPPTTIPTTTEEETRDLWSRFTGTVYESFTKTASRTLPSIRHSCKALWPRFTAPILAGTHSPKEFSKLLIASRVQFQDESLLNPSLISVKHNSNINNKNATTNGAGPMTTLPRPTNPNHDPTPDLSALLPTTARLLLLAAYLSSHNAAKQDLTVFSTYHHGKRKRRGGWAATGRGRPRSKHRKIARKLLGAHAFVLERMMAIFAAVRREWTGDSSAMGGVAASGGGLDGDVGMAISTLASLRLLVRVGGAGGDQLDRGGKWRINVGWEIVRSIGRSIGVEVEEWLVD